MKARKDWRLWMSAMSAISEIFIAKKQLFFFVHSRRKICKERCFIHENKKHSCIAVSVAQCDYFIS